MELFREKDGKLKPRKALVAHYQEYRTKLAKELWTREREAEHKIAYPDMVANPDYVAEVPAVGEQWLPVGDGSFTPNPDYIPAIPAIGDELIPNPDYVEFDEWIQETVVTQVAQDAVYDENNTLVTPAVEEVTALVREFVPPVATEAELDAYLASRYAEVRKTEYPPMEEFMDAYVKDDVAGIQAYKDKCLAVKAKYPKGV